jgi:hypothetical protein
MSSDLELWAEVGRLSCVLREWQIKAIDAETKADRLAAENEKLRALLKRHFARKPEPECKIVDAKRCIACVCGWTKWKLDEMALEDETRAALQDKSDELKGDAVETESGRT